MSAEKNYYLPEGYKENSVRTTMDTVSGTNYWDKSRLTASAVHQYAVYDYAARFAKDNKTQTIIDVGCGPAMKWASFHRDIPSTKIIGIDQEHPIQFCKDNHSFGEWHADDFENPDAALPDMQGDLVVCCDVIEHVLDPNKLLSYLKYRLAKNGTLLISTPDRDMLYGEGQMKAGHPDHIREWNMPEFKAYMEAQGWEVTDHFRLPGIKQGLSEVYLRSFLCHILKKKPFSMEYNQVIVAKQKTT